MPAPRIAARKTGARVDLAWVHPFFPSSGDLQKKRKKTQAIDFNHFYVFGKLVAGLGDGDGKESGI